MAFFIPGKKGEAIVALKGSRIPWPYLHDSKHTVPKMQSVAILKDAGCVQHVTSQGAAYFKQVYTLAQTHTHRHTQSQMGAPRMQHQNVFVGWVHAMSL